ncbi:MAG: Pvc16 family protein, partial [Alphaproteobacteria bacterium]
MAAPSSSALSIACRAIAEFVRSELTDNGSGVQVTIGTPAKAAPQTGETKQLLNLFFYRIEPAGFFTPQGPADPWLIRLYCLITAFGVDEAEDETPPPGHSPPPG